MSTQPTPTPIGNMGLNGIYAHIANMTCVLVCVGLLIFKSVYQHPKEIDTLQTLFVKQLDATHKLFNEELKAERQLFRESNEKLAGSMSELARAIRLGQVDDVQAFQSAGDTAQVAGTVSDALDRAKREKKIVFVRFSASWCGPCRALERYTLSNLGVRKYLQSKAVVVTLDDHARGEMAKYQVRGFPTILILRPDGTELGRIVGYRPPGPFLSELKRLVK